MPVADSAFAELMGIAGRDVPDFVEIENQKPALKTRFYAGEAAAASIAAGAVMAADIWEYRTGWSQRVLVGTREASAALIGFVYHKFHNEDQAPPALQRDGLSFGGFYVTSDNRHIYLHPSFPESTKRLLAVLGCKSDRDAVASVVKDWNAQDLEDAVAEARACAGIARSPEEWESF